MRIALIDDGVDPSRYAIGCLAFDLEVLETGAVGPATVGSASTSSHGTKCAGILRKYAPAAEIGSLRILSRQTLTATRRQLVSALEWCAEQHVPIIHMSLGSTQFQDEPEIRQITSRLLRQGQAVVAAVSNNEVYTVPACLTGVFGVRASPELSENSWQPAQFCGDGVDFIASGTHELLEPDGRIIWTVCSNSYAAPVLTAALHNHWIAASSYSLGDLWNVLTGNCKRVGLLPDFINGPFVCDSQEITLDKSCFFFKEKGYISGRTIPISTLKQPTCLVAIPGESNRLTDFLKQNQYMLAGILYAGEMSPDLYSSLGNCFVWEEGVYQSCLSKLPDAVCPNMPVVDLDGDFPPQFLLELQKRFFQAEYDCLVLSDLPYAYLYGFYWLPQGVDSVCLAGQLGSWKKPSLLLDQHIGHRQREIMNGIRIVLMEKAMKMPIRRRNKIILSRSYCMQYIDMIFNLIREIYSC